MDGQSERVEWVSLKTAARALQEPREQVLRRAITGELRALVVEDRVVIARDTLDRVVVSKAQQAA